MVDRQLTNSSCLLQTQTIEYPQLNKTQDDLNELILSHEKQRASRKRLNACIQPNDFESKNDHKKKQHHSSQPQSSSSSATATATTTTTTATAQAQPNRSHKKEKSFDMSRHRQRHIALRIAYIGANYHGFAMQEGLPTIEEALFQALEKTCLITNRTEINYSRCGRTDRGVNAFGQVISAYLRSKLKCDALGMVPIATAGSEDKRNVRLDD